MRDHAIASPRFWTGDTGKLIRQLGRDYQVISFYLFTCSSSNMIGLYYLPLPTLCHEVGHITSEGASEVLRRLSEVGYAYYDEGSEHVWVPNMARQQVGERLKEKDNRRPAVIRLARQAKKTPFFKDFMAKYGELYDLNNEPDLKLLESPLQAPLKPLRRVTPPQKVDQDQDQGRDQDQGQDTEKGGSHQEGKGKVLKIADPRVRALTPDQLGQLKAAHPDGTYRKSSWLIAERDANYYLGEGRTFEEMLGMHRRYAAQCRAKGIIGTQYVMGPETMYDRSRPLIDEPFPIPKEPEQPGRRLASYADYMANLDQHIGDPDDQQENPQ